MRRNLSAAFALAFTLLLAAACRHENAAASGDPSAAATATPGSLAANPAPGAVPATSAMPAGVAPAPGHGAAPAASPVAELDLSKLPPVVAHVNGVAITKQELIDRAESMRAQMASMGAPAPPQSE